MVRTIKDYIGITVGAVVVALGLNALLIPNRIAAGGASGIATILVHLVGIAPSVTLLVINVPLLIVGARVFGMRFGAYTVLGTFVTIAAVGLTSRVAPLTNDPLLAALYGGVITGIGMGIVFRFRGTTGGTDIAAKLAAHYSGISLGDALLAVDAVVVVVAGVLFSAEYAMYALIAIFVCTKTIDVVQEGLYSAKAVFVVSDQGEAIAAALMNKVERGVTLLPSKGGFSKQEKTTLFCVVGRTELTRAKSVVLEIDRNAFVVVTDAHEVLGEGFKMEV